MPWEGFFELAGDAPEDAAAQDPIELYRQMLAESGPAATDALPTAADVWHAQGEENSCALACQGFVINGLLGVDTVSEGQLIEQARALDIYDGERGGTAVKDIGKLLPLYGLEAMAGFDTPVEALSGALAGGEKVLATVNSYALGAGDAEALPPSLRANHVVQVLQIDGDEAVLNDPGREDGCALRVPLDRFVAAWETGDRYALFAGPAGAGKEVRG